MCDIDTVAVCSVIQAEEAHTFHTQRQFVSYHPREGFEDTIRRRNRERLEHSTNAYSTYGREGLRGLGRLEAKYLTILGTPELLEEGH